MTKSKTHFCAGRLTLMSVAGGTERSDSYDAWHARLWRSFWAICIVGKAFCGVRVVGGWSWG